MIRVLRVEFLRGTGAPFALVLLVVFVVGMLSVDNVWAGTWSMLAQSLRAKFVVVWPLVAAAGVWVAGRDRRRGMRDVLGTVPRPGWHRFLVLWAALTLGAQLSLVVTWLAGAALVARAATYSSGGWGLSLLVCVVSLGAASALGMVVGHFIPWSFAVPATGLVVYAMNLAPGSTGYLLPALDTELPGFMYSVRLSLSQVAWFAAVTFACLCLIGLRRKWGAALPTALAAVAATGVLTTPEEQTYVPDPVALGNSCAGRGPEICVPRYQNHLLEEYLWLREPLRRKLHGIPGVPDRLQYGTFASGYLPGPVNPIAMNVDGSLSDPESVRYTLAHDIVSLGPRCTSATTKASRKSSTAAETATWWLLRGTGTHPRELGISAAATSELTNLLALDENAQREWVARYFAAMRTCDSAGTAALLHT